MNGWENISAAILAWAFEKGRATHMPKGWLHYLALYFYYQDGGTTDRMNDWEVGRAYLLLKGWPDINWLVLMEDIFDMKDDIMTQDIQILDTRKIELAEIVTAFDDETIGSKVTNSNRFMAALARGINQTDFEDQRVPGQALINLSDPEPEVLEAVSAGVGKHTQNPEDYVVRRYRGKVRLFLRRELAEPATSLSAVVYTRDAYLDDPDVQDEPPEYNRIANSECTHILVAVLASAGEDASPLSPGRLVHNLAGGNKEAQEWDADEIRGKAREAVDYYSEWTTVAD